MTLNPAIAAVTGPLARLQAKVAFEELLTLHPHVRVDTAAGERHRSPFVRGWVSLPGEGFTRPA